MTFNGKSFIRWRFTVPLEKRLTVSLDLKTIQQKARIMHAVGPIDYSILEVSRVLYPRHPQDLDST